MKDIEAIFNKKLSILFLLPYSEDSELTNKHQKLDDLLFIKAVVKFAIVTLNRFVSGMLSDFDAQVGENLCQIRAYKILQLSHKWLISAEKRHIFSEKINDLIRYKEKLNQIIRDFKDAVEHSFEYNKDLDEVEHINDFLERNRIFLELDKDLIFIVACGFLTHFNIRREKIPIAIDLKSIAKEFSISKYRSKRLTHKYQIIVTKFGCDFILKLSKDFLPNFGYLEVLPALYKVSDEDRVVLPCYIASEVIFLHAIKQNVPILFIVKIKIESEVMGAIYFLLKGNEKSGFSLEPHENYSSQFCMIVSGETEIIYSLSTESLKNYTMHVLSLTPLSLILANTAMHPQYTGKRLSLLRDNPFLLIKMENSVIDYGIHELKWLAMKNFASQEGCSKERPGTFFLCHIYANKVGEELNKLHLEYGDFLYDAFQLKGHLQ